MKRRALVCSLLVVGLAIAHMMFAPPSLSQPPPSAATVLANMQKYYAGVDHLSAAFRQTVTNTTFNTTKTSDGHLWVAKPSSFRWDYSATRHGSLVVTKNFIFDGTTLWAIDHTAKQILQMKAQANALPAVTSFFSGGTALTKQFTVALDMSGTYGTTGTFVLKLTPNQPSASYRELFFVVDPANWHVTETIVRESSGNASRFTFSHPDTTTEVKPSWFQVNLATLVGYRVVKP